MGPRSGRLLRRWLALLAALTGAGLVWLHLTGVGADELSPAVVLLAWSPSLAAVVVAALPGGGGGVGALLAPVRRIRFGAHVWAVAVGLPFAVVVLARATAAGLGHPAPAPWLDLGALLPGLGAILAGSLGEELGWRGLAQPVLERRRSVFGAAVVVGVLWATWHCWAVLAPGGTGDWRTDVPVTYLRLVPTAVIYAWILTASRGSLLAVMVAHAAHDVAVTAIPVPDDDPTLGVLVAVLYLLGAAVVCVAARQQLFRAPGGREPGRLGG